MMNTMMEITTMIGCFLRCRYCPQSLLIKAYEQACAFSNEPRPIVMSMETFQTCIDRIPANVDIHFSGMCEPWQNPACTQMLLYANEKKHKIHVFTTLMGMRMEDYYTIRDLPLETVILHVPDTEGNSHFLISDEYLNILKQILQDARENRFHIDGFSCHGVLHPSVCDMIQRSGIYVNTMLNDRAGNIDGEAQLISRRLNTGRIECGWCKGNALDKNVLLPDGTVLLCCMDYGMRYPLGNLLRQEYDEISEGQAKQHLRNMMDSDEENEILCRKCSRCRPV